MSMLGVGPSLGDEQDPESLAAMFSEEDLPDDEATEPVEPGTTEEDPDGPVESDGPPEGWQPPEGEAPASPPPPPTQAAEETPAAEIGIEEGEEEGEGEEEEEEELIEGRFRTQEAADLAYKEIQAGFTRMAQENRQLLERLQAQDDQIRQLTQMQYQQLAENDPELAEQWQAEQQRQAEIQEAVQAQVAPIMANQARDRAQQTVASFYQSTGIAPGSEADQAVTQSFAQLRQAGVDLDITNPDHLQLALEAAAFPQFGAELMFAPNALKIPGGLDTIRQRSGVTIPDEVEGSPGTQPASPPGDGTRQEGSPDRTQPKPRKAERRRVSEAFVESPSGGAPAEAAPGKTPDEFGEAWDYYQNRRNRGPLFSR